LANRVRNLTYITAERIGPREVYPLEDRQIAAVVGPAGEHAMSVLHWGRDEPVLDGLIMPNAINKRLQQVQARMQQFFPGSELDVQQVPKVNAVTLGLRTSIDTDFHRPIHVGFGLTQVLPIVIAALSAAKDDILLIENPEVHLHPAGQALMGQFLTEVANAGVQIIVETHSDHVLNGIRRAVKSKRIQPKHVALHFFRPRSTDVAQVVSPQIDATGNIDTWPDGFFDQFDKDMNHFAGWD
jgi:predicted ATPase